MPDDIDTAASALVADAASPVPASLPVEPGEAPQAPAPVERAPHPIEALIERWWNDHFPGSEVARYPQAWARAFAAKEKLKRLLKGSF